MENQPVVPRKGRLVRALEVQRESDQVLWVRIQYFKNGELLHDVRFVPSLKYGEKWVVIGERIVGDFIPKNRYRPMLKKAIAIIHPSRKRLKPAVQLNLPLGEQDANSHQFSEPSLVQIQGARSEMCQ